MMLKSLWLALASTNWSIPGSKKLLFGHLSWRTFFTFHLLFWPSPRWLSNLDNKNFYKFIHLYIKCNSFVMIENPSLLLNSLENRLTAKWWEIAFRSIPSISSCDHANTSACSLKILTSFLFSAHEIESQFW